MRSIVTAILAAILISCTANREKGEEYALLPMAKEATFTGGKFMLDRPARVTVKATGTDSATIAGHVASSGMKIDNSNGKAIEFNIEERVEGVSSPEGYRIETDGESIRVTATGCAGLFYALQTIIQFKEQCGHIPCGTIVDEPAFAYRGMMLDVSRHFFGKEFIKKQIKALAHFKINRLHLHLTDAAGWRVEIKRYPRLTRFAAWRSNRLWKDWWYGDRLYAEEGSPQAHGGYYTQEDIREIVSYAAEHYITVIPEIEMPAHSEEVLAAYPELSCTHEPYKQADFCPGNEKSFEFLENVLTEIMELFPSEYIHIGGDEAAKVSWGQCPLCRARMKEESLESVNELQSYFIKRIERFVNSKGRRIIGWDEIMEGGTPPNATVMAWRGSELADSITKEGHMAIMSPGGYCYLDSYQDAPETQPMAFGPYLPLEKVYSYNPVPRYYDSARAKLIYGIQGNLWTEYIPTEEMVEYMAYPRMLAIAEIGWSNPKERDYLDFKKRATKATTRLRSMGYNAFDLAGEHGERSEALNTANHLAKGTITTYSPHAPYNSKYNGGGATALTDGIRGGWTYTDGRWQGFIKGGIDVTIDLGAVKEIKGIKAAFMQMCMPEVWLPEEVTISVSRDNSTFSEVAHITHAIEPRKPFEIKEYGWQGETAARYIRYCATRGRYGGWLFTDEIIVE